ncbi:uncharacterized protein LOC130941988 isoform X1 [Arachis stenosperma]|uniref:uncharacterized protein LOC130941988 isoform X1 n=1 Tax=Arachis stenosperma TaxID=217475 RepID=UPI0025ABBADF|nr:uncharacterized protein LOC130941988 isoform X1 [Arachis stenosperma]
MTWRRLLEPVAAHASLLCFTALLLLKLHHRLSLSWWIIFFPLWIFHAIVAQGRFSLPGLSARHNQNWATGHAVVAMPLLTAFELLLCIYLESICVRGAQVVNMKIVFLPLLIFEIIILMENFRLCRALMPGDEENMSAEVIWETPPHFSVAISRVFFITTTIFTLLKLSGDLLVLSWWDLFVNLAIVECFAFLVCTKWSNLVTSGLVVSSEGNRRLKRMCNMQDIIMEVPVIVFQILICRYLEGAPACAEKKPAPSFFSFLFQLQSAGVMFAASALVEKLILLLNSGAAPRIYSRGVSRVHDCYLGLLHHGSRFLGWFSIAERSQEEQEKLDCEGSSGYNTFSGNPPVPEIIKKMPKKDLAEEVWRLQTALGEQAEITKCREREYERLKNEKILCRICFQREISIVLLPCRHRSLCSTCAAKCKNCPICRDNIIMRLPVYDA